MVDNLRRYRAIRKSLSQIFCNRQNGNMVRHMNTLAALINGIVGSKSCQLPSIASKMVDATHADSRIKKYHRWLKNEDIDYETYYFPYASALLSNFQSQKLPLAIDCSGVGAGCSCLMISLLYKNRALPLIWHVFPQKKGHLTQEAHIHLINALKPLIPPDKSVVLVGDGEFDGTLWLQQIQRSDRHCSSRI